MAEIDTRVSPQVNKYSGLTRLFAIANENFTLLYVSHSHVLALIASQYFVVNSF